MKKILPILCAATFAFAAQTCPGTILDFYEEHSIGTVTVNYKWRYDLDETSHTATLLRGLDLYGDVTIKNLIAVGDTLYTLTKIADGACADNYALLSVTIPNTILEVGAGAFSNCTALAKVTFTYGIRYIGERAFANTIIREIALPDSLLDMGSNISAGTLFTDNISISDSSHFKHSEDGVLYNRDMTKLYACPTRAEGTVTIPNTVTNIAADAFFGCHRLSYLNLPATVNTIGSGAFNVAGIWPGLKAPESNPKLLSIFYNGPAPAAADDIYTGAPAGLINYALDESWSGMTTWKGREVKFIAGPNPPILSYTDDATGITWYFRVVDNVAEIWNNGTTAVSSADQLTDISLPTELGGYLVKGLGDGALSDMRGIRAVSIPDTYEWIGDGAFSNCTSLAGVSLNYGIRYIGERAFVNTIIKEIALPDSLLDMGGNISAGTLFTDNISISDSSHFKHSEDGVLYNRDMTKLYACPTRAEESITIPDTVTHIATDAFFGCHRLAHLDLPSSVNAIGSGAFNVAGIWPGLDAPESTPKLEEVTFKGSVPEAADDIFNGAPSNLVINAFTEEWKGMSTWKGRSVKILDSPNDFSATIDDITWSCHVEDGKVTIKAASGESDAVTIPAAIGGYEVADIGAGALNGISKVSEYKSDSDHFKTRNGCLYSADGKILIRVPDVPALPYSIVETEEDSTITVTVVPGINEVGNDNTTFTTNVLELATSCTTNRVAGDISPDTILKGVTSIADYAFYGCNNLSNSCTSTSEAIDGETGFTRGDDAYLKTKLHVITHTTEYLTVLEVGKTVSVGVNATKGSGVKIKRRSPIPNASYVASILSGTGDVIGSATVKVGKTIDKVTATVTTIGESTGKKVVKSLEELEKYGEVIYFMDVSKSDKTAFNKFKGKCWTLAFAPAEEAPHPLLGGYTALSIIVKSKGKVQIKGTAADGTKISASAQMVKDGDSFKIPATVRMYARKRGGFSTVFTIRGDALEVENGAVSFTAVVGGEQLVSPLGLVASAPLGNAEFESLRIWGHEDEYELADGQKMPRYTKSTGLIKGKLTLYRKSDGKRVKANVNGVAVDGIGYGSAVMKNTASWPVELR